MAQGKRPDPELRAAVVDYLQRRHSITSIAKRFGLARLTIRKIKREQGL